MTKINIKISPKLIRSDEEVIVIEIDEHCNLTTKTASRAKRPDGIAAYISSITGRLNEDMRQGTADNYICAMRSLKRFTAGADITFDEFDADTVSRYEAYLRQRGLKMNTVSFYMRTLRAIYNRAVSEGLTADKSPFKNVYTGNCRTSKRAVALNVIRAISRMQTASPQQAWARDMFMFSFYTRGMSFVDMAYLKKTDLKDGMLTYRRKKTGQTLMVRWEKCMQDIVDAHPSGNDIYMLPLIRRPGIDERRQYKSSQRMANRELCQIGETLLTETPLTMYVARHSWASIAKQMQIPMNVISESMGHTSLKTTQIYLKSLDHDIIDKANAKILKQM